MNERYNIDPSIRWYLAGPMTGVPQFNYPLFNRVQWKLEGAGFEVVNPVTHAGAKSIALAMRSIDGNAFRFAEAARAEKTVVDSYAVSVGKGVAAVLSCGGVLLLPGWETSKGARCEVFAALTIGKQFAIWDETTETAHVHANREVRAKLAEWLQDPPRTEHPLRRRLLCLTPGCFAESAVNSRHCASCDLDRA